MEARLAHALQQSSGAQALGAVQLAEHLAILKRWYFRSSRLGEIFFADSKGDLPWRRIVRAVGRVYKGEREEPEVPVRGAAPVIE
jgi:excinuclease ABC subunit C